MASPQRKSAWSYGRILKAVRRVHLYLGLMFFPWAMLFGVSGLLFNHPNVGERVHAVRLGPKALAEATGLEPWAPRELAGKIVQGLNAGATGHYRLSEGFEAELSGVSLFSAGAPGGRHTVLLDMQQGMAIVATRQARPAAPPAPFAGRKITLPEYTTAELEARLAPMLHERALESTSPLKAHPKISQQLRFRMQDERGVEWNTIYDVRSGELRGRRTDTPPAMGVAQWLGKLHTAHHFPAQAGWGTLWALFEDLLGLTLALWGLSGLVMWWQMKPTRRWGTPVVALAVALSAAAIWGVSSDLTFGPVGQTLGPGD